MTDLPEYRDHSQPCKHDQYFSHQMPLEDVADGYVYQTCPGGRAVTLRDIIEEPSKNTPIWMLL